MHAKARCRQLLSKRFQSVMYSTRISVSSVCTQGRQTARPGQKDRNSVQVVRTITEFQRYAIHRCCINYAWNSKTNQKWKHAGSCVFVSRHPTIKSPKFLVVNTLDFELSTLEIFDIHDQILDLTVWIFHSSRFDNEVFKLFKIYHASFNSTFL